MRVACQSAAALILLSLSLVHTPISVHSSDAGEEVHVDILIVLCGTISADAMTDWQFYVTCPVTVQAGVTLEMGGMGYVSPFAGIAVYGTLYLSAELTWNTTSTPPAPEDWRWGGIHVYSPGHIEASGFWISHAQDGIGISGTSGNTIRYGAFVDIVGMSGWHDGYAVSIYHSDDNTIEDITVRDGWGGIDIPEEASGNLIRASSFISLMRGIRLGFDAGSVTRNSIVCNDFSENEYHIASLRADDNPIHHNNFLGQGMAYEETANIWDDGYPSGGNYWANYSGNDNYRGPNQDVPGPDGIGDEPYKGIYNFDSGNYDNYPFINPVPSANCPSPPPEMPKGPLPPFGLSANLEGPSSSNVHISWMLSQDDGQQGFLGYAIYYSEIYSTDGSGYRFLAEVPPAQNSYSHTGAGHGDPSNYFYYVQANDTSGFPGVSSSQVGKYSQNLQKGVNMIFVPLTLEDYSYASVFQTTTAAWIRAYNATTGEWEMYNPMKPYQDPMTLSSTKGYWLEVSQSGQMTIAGTVPKTTETQLQTGWNLVGFPAFSDLTVSSSLSGVPYEVVEGYDPTNQPYLLRTLLPGDVMTAGNVYWIKVSSPCTWIVSN